VAAVALALALAAPAAWAQPTLHAGGAELDESTGDLVLFLAGRAADGSPAPVSDPQLFLGQKDPIAPAGRDKLLDYSADRPKWTPPFAIGVVYLWAKGSPQTILDGLEALFRHVPRNLPVYPTPYGQGHRQVATRLTAARVAGGELADYPQMPGDQHKLVNAVKFNVSKLSEERAPIKQLFIITDGRGPASGKEFGPFAALGEDLRRQGIQVAIVALPSPVDQADAEQNVKELADAARARLIRVDRLADVPTSIELLGEMVSSVERVSYELPWLARQLGGEHKVSVRGAVAGASVRAAAITVVLPRRAGMLVALVLGAVLAIAVAFVGLRIARARTGGPAAPARSPAMRAAARPGATSGPEAAGGESDPNLAALAEVVRVGAPPARAVLSLARTLGPGTEELAGADRRSPRDGVLGTRAGQARVREIRKLLAQSRPHEVFVREVAPILAGALREQAGPREGARRLRARLPIESWTAVLRLSPDALEAALAASPELGAGGGRTFVRDVQAELQRGPGGAALALWLVRVAGPGTPGETIVIGGSSVIGGAGAEVVLSTEDRIPDSAAQISIEGNDAALTPLEGKVQIDDEEVGPETPLYDGQTLSIGRGLYVVRLVRKDVALAESRSAPRAGRPGSGRRAVSRRR
jgi:hypothetical protein